MKHEKPAPGLKEPSPTKTDHISGEKAQTIPTNLEDSGRTQRGNVKRATPAVAPTENRSRSQTSQLSDPQLMQSQSDSTTGGLPQIEISEETRVLESTQTIVSSQDLVRHNARTRTPDGPRSVNMDTFRNNPQSRAPNFWEPGQQRAGRYESTRTVSRETGFRAPPPTGPRAGSFTGTAISTSTHVTTNRIHQPARSSTGSDTTHGPKGPTMPYGPDRTSVSIPPSANQAITPNIGYPSTILRAEYETDSLQRSAASALSVESDTMTTRRENRSPHDVPRGPSEWRGRSKRDLQDDDPRRLSRNSDTWGIGGESQRQPTRNSEGEIKGRERDVRKGSHKEQGSGETLSHYPPEVARPISRSEQGRLEQNDDQKRGPQTYPENIPLPEVLVRERTQLGHPPSPRPENKRDHKPSRNAKDMIPVNTDPARAEGRGGNRGRVDTAFHAEQQDLSVKVQKPPNNRDEDSVRRMEEQESLSRNRKDEPKESRHGSRDGHHLHPSRRSPNRGQSERGDRRDRGKETERLSGSRRDSRDFGHRERTRSSRETGHRRDGRDRTGGEREADDRRAPRKHDRDNSGDDLDKSGRSGEDRSAPDPVLASKRRRVER
jgi:hypothetical protein